MGITGTTVMTLFSYLYTYYRKKEFREPVVLARLLENLPFGKHLPRAGTHISGWLAHYLVGIIFAVVEKNWLKNESVRKLPESGVWTGAALGGLGIGIWEATFLVHPQPPKIHVRDYYLHLLLAHMLFGWGAEKGAKMSSWLERQ